MNTEIELTDFAFQRMTVDTKGANPEPRLDSSWREFKKLTWKAGVVHDETGLDVAVERTLSDHFNVKVGYTLIGAGTYQDAWSLLTGVATGAREAKRATEATR